MKARTKSSTVAWKAPDGGRTIWDVILSAEGKEYPLQTFSEKIAEPGFEGEIETYTNAKGKKFVRQVPKQDTPQAGTSGYQPRDDEAIQAQFAIKAAVAALPQADTTGDNHQYLVAVEALAKAFKDMVPRVKGGQ